MRFSLRSLAGLLALVVAMPACAGLFDDDEARARIEKLRTDVGEITQHIDELNQRADTLSHSQLDFTNQLESIRSDLAKSRGQLEVLTYELEAAQKRQKDFYVDLDNRLRKLEQLAAEAEQQRVAAPSNDAQNETRDYEVALSAFKAAKYKEAETGFLELIKDYPNSQLQPSAHYWAAASLRQQRQFKEAAEMFGMVAGKWPDDVRAADALLAQADCQQDAGDPKGSRKTLESLVVKYPTSDAAKTAKARLKKK